MKEEEENILKKIVEEKDGYQVSMTYLSDLTKIQDSSFDNCTNCNGNRIAFQ